MVQPDIAVEADGAVAWFCLRSQPKHEHIAARHLRCMEAVEVFNPRVRFARPTRKGPVWVTEAMFPNYLFARFDWKISLSRVHYAPGVSNVVHFGSRWPTVPNQIIAQMRVALGENEIQLVSNELAPGDPVRIAGGTFHGLQAVITQVMPARDRVMVLMDFLGRQTTVELGMNSIIKQTGQR